MREATQGRRRGVKIKIVKDSHFDSMFKELEKDPEYLAERKRIEDEEKALSKKEAAK